MRTPDGVIVPEIKTRCGSRAILASVHMDAR